MSYPQELIDFYYQNKDYKSKLYQSFRESIEDLECAYYPIKFDFDTDILLKECQNIDHLYYNHRSKDNKKGYGHNGWQSITLHGIAEDKTEHFVQYGFNSLEEANYCWTEVCNLLPNLTSFLQSLPYKKFDRVRIMKLGAGGYIMPHTDGKGRIFSPLNIAINNPEGCHFVFKDKGIVPFESGTGMIVDVGREHMVINNSSESRYHIIVHGHYKKEFYNL